MSTSTPTRSCATDGPTTGRGTPVRHRSARRASSTTTCGCSGGKQVLKWVGSPEAAFDFLLRLNNEHFLDGRSPNSFANVAWIFGLHDRAWQETDVAGKTRPMTRSGLESKIGKRKLRAWMDEVAQTHGELHGD